MGAHLTRRTLFKGAMGSAALAPLAAPATANATVAAKAPAQDARYEPDQFPADDELFWAPGLPGGGQMEVRMHADPYSPDPDIRAIAQKLYPFNLGSYYTEFMGLAEKYEALAAHHEAQGDRVKANQYYLKAAGVYTYPQAILAYLSEHDPRMMPTYEKLEKAFGNAWRLVSPPFERVQIPYEGHMLDGLFFAAPVPAGHRAPVVMQYQGADSTLLDGSPDAGAPYTSRGISFLNVDGPGQGGSLRLKNLYAPPDAERYAKAVVDYLVTRRDVDPDRIGITGLSMGGYGAPRSLTGEKRLKVGAFWAGAFDLQRDIFDYYPPIQDKLRWLIGAKNLKEARAKMAEFTLRNRVREIEAPILIGYSSDDRVMNPGGALELFDKAVNARSRELLPGAGHAVGGPPSKVDRTTAFADFFAKQFGTA